jgi:hypothetical protein
VPPLGGWKTGVYGIRNRINGKVYVGSASKSLAGRIRGHLSGLTKGTHFNRHLQAAWNRYGATAKAKIAAKAKGRGVSQDTRDRMRESHISRWADPNRHATMSLIHEKRCRGGSGRAQLLEMNRRSSLVLKGRVLTPEARAKISEATWTAMADPKVRAKLRAAKRRRHTRELWLE